MSSELEGVEETDRKLAAFELQLRDLRPFWPTVKRMWRGWMTEQFASQGAFFGDPWAPLSARYAAIKAVKFPGRGILVAEGDLKRGSINPEWRATSDDLKLEIKWNKGGKLLDPDWHQRGNTQGMPARPILPVGDDLPAPLERQLEHATSEYVLSAARRAGLLASR